MHETIDGFDMWTGHDEPLIEHIVQRLINIVALLEYHCRPGAHGEFNSIYMLHQVEVRLVIAEARTEEDLRVSGTATTTATIINASTSASSPTFYPTFCPASVTAAAFEHSRLE